MKVKTYKFVRNIPPFHKPDCTRKAILSLQLIDGYYDEPTFKITVNKFNWKKWKTLINLNPVFFGSCLSNNRLITKDAHEFLVPMFINYVNCRQSK